MTDCPRRRRFHASGSLFALIAMISLPLPALAETDLGIEPRHPEVIEAVINHPSVAGARARICGAASQYDRARSQELPQIDLSLRGSSSISSHIERAETQGRRLDDKEVDAVIGLNQVLFDWGLTEADKNIALNERANSRLAMVIEIDRAAADIIDISLTVAQHRERLELYDAYIAELAPLAERIEASVNAGVLRIGDLRAIKVIELDAEIARSLAERQVKLAETELNNRFGLTFEQARVLLDRFLAHRPELPPVLDSTQTREVQRLDLQIKATQFELDKLTAERYPRLLSSLDMTLFDVDGYSQEYELAGNLRLTMPFYDGGSNQARRSETRWQRRGLESERSNTIRQHSNVASSTIQNIDRARETLDANAVKIVEVEIRLAEARARQGQTISDPLSIARTIEQLTNIRAEQISLRAQVELGLLQGVFFADQLGSILEMPYGGPSC